jgi:hypothetical protein
MLDIVNEFTVESKGVDERDASCAQRVVGTRVLSVPSLELVMLKAMFWDFPLTFHACLERLPYVPRRDLATSAPTERIARLALAFGDVPRDVMRTYIVFMTRGWYMVANTLRSWILSGSTGKTIVVLFNGFHSNVYAVHTVPSAWTVRDATVYWGALYDANGRLAHPDASITGVFCILTDILLTTTRATAATASSAPDLSTTRATAAAASSTSDSELTSVRERVEHSDAARTPDPSAGVDV